MLRYQLKNMIFTPATVISILGLYLFLIVSIYPNPYNDVVYNYQYATQLGYGAYFIPIAVVLPVCFYLHHSGKDKDAQFSLIRSGLRSYTSGTVMSAILSGMVVTLSAFILFTISCFLVDSPEGPAYFGDGLMQNSYAYENYSRFLAHPVQLYLIMGAIYTLNGAMWPVISLLCFSFTANQYVVVAIPFILRIVLGFIGEMTQCYFLDPSQLQLFGGVSASWFGGGVPYMLGYMGIVILLCGGIWIMRTYRRARHG